MRFKTIKEARFEPYGEDQIINVPKDRHRLTIKQKAEATEYFQHTDFCIEYRKQ